MNVIVKKGGIIELPKAAMKQLLLQEGDLLACTVTHNEIRLFLSVRGDLAESAKALGQSVFSPPG